MKYNENAVNLFRQALKYFEDCNQAEVIKLLTKAVEIEPQFAQAYELLGIACSETEMNDQAVEYLTEAIKINPLFDTAFLNRGNAYMGKKDFDNAIKDYTEAIRLMPDEYSIFAIRGEAYMEKGELSLAKSDIEETLNFNNEDEYALGLLEKLKTKEIQK